MRYKLKTPTAPIVDVPYRMVTAKPPILSMPRLSPQAKSFVSNLLTGIGLGFIAIVTYQLLY